MRACCGQALFLQESFKKTGILQDARLLRPSALFARVVLKNSFLKPPSAKIRETGGAKKVRGSGRERPESKKGRFDWKFPIGPSKTWHFPPVFGVFDPSKPRLPPKNLQENMHFARCALVAAKRPFCNSRFGELVFEAPEHENQRTRWGKKSSRVRPGAP